MTSFRFKVLVFMLPMLLPIGHVDAPHEAQSETPLPAIESPARDADGHASGVLVIDR